MSFHRPRLEDLLLAACYFASASLALLLTRFDGGVAFLWIAASFLIAVLMVKPRREWATPVLLCFLASVAATGLFGLGWKLAIPFGIANMVEALVAARVFRQYRHAHLQLGSLPWLLHFGLAVGIAGPAAAALIAAGTAGLVGMPIAPTLLKFLAGHALGNLTFIPLITLFVRPDMRRTLVPASRHKAIEAAILLSAVTITAWTVFSSDHLPLLFLPMLPLILVTFRLGQGSTAIGVAIVALVGGGLTLGGHGPIHLVNAPLGTQLQFFQFYLAATVLTVLPVSADLRNRASMHRSMRLSEERYRLLADNSTDIILHMDPAGFIRYASPSIRQLGGYDPNHIEGTNILRLVPMESRQQVLDGHLATIAAGGDTCSYRHLAITAGGEHRWFESHCRVILDDIGQIDGVLSVVRDIDRQVATEDKLEVAAMTDSLTGLANRRAFRTTVQTIINNADQRPVSIAIIDIDHFKLVNDRFGHDAGDSVLKSFATIAQSVVRRDDMVARLGGEEFGLVLPGIGSDEAAIICERLRLQVAAAVSITDAGAVSVTISGGVAELGSDGLDAALKVADEALYRAKREGRDRMRIAA